MKISTEINYKVFCDDHGTHVNVGPDRDALGLVEISGDYFTGNVFHSFPSTLARAIGEALIKAANDIDKEVK